ncbi:MAG TPA: thioesterase family protein [Gemmataceae bacterium]|nr:thioesterase family protein [Gemmataceae bacterium]
MSEPFRTTRRVEFHETDMAGIVHFSNFFRYMEFAEVEFLRARGLSVAWQQTHGERIGFPRVAAACDYRRPVRFDDLVEIEVKIARVGGKSVTYEFDFTCRGQEIAHGKMTAAYVKEIDGQIAAVAIPPDLRARLES